MDKEQNLEGVRGFPLGSFAVSWEQRKLGDIMNVTSVKRIHQSDWTDSGIRFLRARDIVSASKNEEPDDYLYISKEKYDEYSLVSGKVAIGDLLVTGVGTIGVPYLIRNSEPLYFKDGNIIWFQNGTKIDGDFFLYSFFGKAIQDFINESAGIGTVGTYTIESGKKTPISLPEMREQQQIGAFFKNLDNLITLHQRKCQIDGCRFQSPLAITWEQRKFDDITYPAGEKNRDNLPYESYSVTNENGFIPQNEQFENGGTMATADKSMYYIVSKNSFAYNPARINVGSIGYYDKPENVIVSSLYEVFKTSEDIDDRFLWHWFKSDAFQRMIEQYQEGGVRLYFYYDKLCMCSLPVPDIQEQRKIGKQLDILDNLITLHQCE